jgi:hypothetical protein
VVAVIYNVQRMLNETEGKKYLSNYFNEIVHLLE